MKRAWELCAALCLTVTGCTVGPNYHRPAVGAPAAYRGLAPAAHGGTAPAAHGGTAPAAHGGTAPAAHGGTAPTAHGGTAPTATAPQATALLQWWQEFHDPELQKLLREALANNYNLKVAAARIDEISAELGLIRAKGLPQITGSATNAQQRLSQIGLPRDRVSGDPQGSANIMRVDATWEIDFWGKYRRESEAGRARMLAAVDAQRAVQTTLVAEVASAYFDLLALDQEKKDVTASLTTRRESLELTTAREKGGVASLVDVDQARTLVSASQELLANLQRSITLRENEISTLIGENPQAIPRTMTLEQESVPVVPAGLPSSLLERRPDILEAEESLHAANADLGVARAAYFPNIALTANEGTESTAFHNLFTGASQTWFIQPQLSVPIFAEGRIRAGVAESQAAYRAALNEYLQTVKQSFRDVSDALAERARAEAVLKDQATWVRNAEDAAWLAEQRYRGGVASYLEVLSTERDSLRAQLDLARDRYSALDASVQLYRALGGGWR